MTVLNEQELQEYKKAMSAELMVLCNALKRAIEEMRFYDVEVLARRISVCNKTYDN